MSVNPVSSGTAVQQNEQVANQHPNVSKQPSAIPQDTVDISSEAKAKQASSSGDVDHDGDRK